MNARNIEAIAAKAAPARNVAAAPWFDQITPATLLAASNVTLPARSVSVDAVAMLPG